MAKRRSTNKKDKPEPAPRPTYSALFEDGDPHFLRAILSCYADPGFRDFALKWHQDPRPFAREALYQYIDDGCDRRGHRLLVKQLFTAAERAKDHALMSRFVVAFDRLNRRKLIDSVEGKRLVQTHHPQIKTTFDSKLQSYNAARFTRDTRLYLQRRAWRYLRQLAHQNETSYWREIKDILPRYQDEHLAKTERLLDSWGLVHILYGASRVLRRQSRGVIVRRGRSLSELQPAPFCEDAWRGKFLEIFELLFISQSRAVRVALRGFLQRGYRDEVTALPFSSLRRLLSSPHEDIQQLGLSLLREPQRTSSLGLHEWLSLLQIQDVTLTSTLATLAQESLSDRDLPLSQYVLLACVAVEGVARLGFSLCMKRAEAGAALLEMLPLASAEVPAIRAEAVSYLLRELASSPEARSEHLREMIDSKFEDTRAEALALMKSDVRYRDSATLWGAMSESPYDDVRAHLLRHLQERAPTFASNTLHALWASALLAINRGGRTKQTVLTQMAERLSQRPEEVHELCALLAIALRSVRAPERRGAIAAIAKAAWSRPELRPIIEERLPSLRLSPEAA
jgi:hypothetical protein